MDKNNKNNQSYYSLLCELGIRVLGTTPNRLGTTYTLMCNSHKGTLYGRVHNNDSKSLSHSRQIIHHYLTILLPHVLKQMGVQLTRKQEKGGYLHTKY